jgi:hypothetical protein
MLLPLQNDEKTHLCYEATLNCEWDVTVSTYESYGGWLIVVQDVDVKQNGKQDEC